jgi:hypothetical protein
MKRHRKLAASFVVTVVCGGAVAATGCDDKPHYAANPPGVPSFAPNPPGVQSAVPSAAPDPSAAPAASAPATDDLPDAGRRRRPIANPPRPQP